jgi:hypothetical protein
VAAAVTRGAAAGQRAGSAPVPAAGRWPHQPARRPGGTGAARTAPDRSARDLPPQRAGNRRGRTTPFEGPRVILHGRSGGRRGPAADQRQAAEGDATQDGGAARDLDRPGRVAEQDDPGHGADQRLDVDEGPGHLGRNPALPVGEQGERRQRAGRGERGGDQHRAGGVRHGRQALGRGRERQRGERGPQELHGGDRDRVAAAQEPGLGHGERGRQQERHEHQPVATERGAAAVAPGDEGYPGQRHREPGPRNRTGHGAVPERRDDRHQHRHRADQQRGLGDAGPGDAGVLQQDRTAVADRAGGQHRRGAAGTQRAPGGHGQQDRGGHAEAHGGEPARRQPFQG